MSDDPKPGPNDELLMRLIRKHFNPDFQKHLLCTRWKDGIDIDGPTFAIQQAARDIWRDAFNCAQPEVTDEIVEKVALDETFQARLQRYAHGNGSSHAIARAAITAFLAAQRRER